MALTRDFERRARCDSRVHSRGPPVPSCRSPEKNASSLEFRRCDGIVSFASAFITSDEIAGALIDEPRGIYVEVETRGNNVAAELE